MRILLVCAVSYVTAVVGLNIVVCCTYASIVLLRVPIWCTHTSNPYGRVQPTLVCERAVELIDYAGAHTHASVRRVRYDYSSTVVRHSCEPTPVFIPRYFHTAHTGTVYLFVLLLYVLQFSTVCIMALA